jgi:hypothetical protein
MPQKLFFCLDFSEQLRVLNWNRKKLFLVLKNIFISAYYQYYNLENKKNDYWFYDGYNNTFAFAQVKLKHLEDRILFQFYKNEIASEFADLNIIYLNKIITFCKNKNISLTFLTTPLHYQYTKKIPNKFKSKFNSFDSKNRINRINLENLILSDSCFVPDGDHVTIKGAEITTRILMGELN